MVWYDRQKQSESRGLVMASLAEAIVLGNKLYRAGKQVTGSVKGVKKGLETHEKRQEAAAKQKANAQQKKLSQPKPPKVPKATPKPVVKPAPVKPAQPKAGVPKVSKPKVKK